MAQSAYHLLDAAANNAHNAAACGRVGVALGLQEVVERQHRSGMQQAKRRPAVAASAEIASALQARMATGVLPPWA